MLLGAGLLLLVLVRTFADGRLRGLGLLLLLALRFLRSSRILSRQASAVAISRPGPPRRLCR